MKLPGPHRIVQGFGMEAEYLYTQEQMREALANHELVMRMALGCLKTTEEYLRIEVHEAYARDANISTIEDWKLKLTKHRKAIKVLKEQLK